jgi:putative membrane protein
MERAQHLKTKFPTSPPVVCVLTNSNTPSQTKQQILLITIIILFHVVGIIGLAIPGIRPLFLKLVPLHIVVMLAVIVGSHKLFSERFLFFFIIIFITGFVGEWLGVHKNWIFGDYHYGKTLGWSLFDIPLTIGVNWFLLVYSTSVLIQRLRVRSVFVRVITGAIILVLLDILIEPVAIKFDYWHWTNNIIPFSNYAGWCMVSALMLYIFELFHFKKQSIVGPVLLITQFLFFGLLHFL